MFDFSGVFEFLGWVFGDYIRIHLVTVLTYLTSSLQSSLQNQTKQEGNEIDDFNYNFISLILYKDHEDFF